MKYTKNLLNNIIKVLKYQYYSRLILIAFSALTIFSVFNLYAQMSQTKDLYSTYLNTVKHYETEGMDVQKALNSSPDIQVTTEEDGTIVTEVNNVILYDYNNVAHSIFIMKPDKIVTQTLEWMSFVFYPFIFTVYGIYMATYDLKYKTIKLRAVQDEWKDILLSKLLSSFLATIIMITASLVVSYLFGLVFYKMIDNSIPINEFKFVLQTEHNVILQFLLSIFICLFFLMIGFYLGLIFKGFMVPTIIFVIYNFIVPVLGKYDIRNIISILGHKVFDFAGRFQLFIPTKMSIGAVSMFLSCFIIITTLAVYLISKKQNKYII